MRSFPLAVIAGRQGWVKGGDRHDPLLYAGGGLYLIGLFLINEGAYEYFYQ